MALLQAGVGLMHIREFLGYKPVLKTDIYAKVNPKFTVSIRPTPYCEWFPECLKLQDEKDKQRSVLFPVL
jgi:hypothetical protein